MWSEDEAVVDPGRYWTLGMEGRDDEVSVEDSNGADGTDGADDADRKDKDPSSSVH